MRTTWERTTWDFQPNKSAFVGWMAYNRIWFDHNRFAVTVGGGAMNNPGRYLTLLPQSTAVGLNPQFPVHAPGMAHLVG
jgi:hypothetical protein